MFSKSTLGETWACSRATHAFTCTQTHKNTVAVPPTCFATEQTSPPTFTITGPDLCHKRQEGPRPAGPAVWSETRRRQKQVGSPDCTLLLTFRLRAVSRALLLVQEALRAQRGFGVEILLVWTRLLHLWQATGKILSEGEMKRKSHALGTGQWRQHTWGTEKCWERNLTSPVWWTWYVPSGSSRPPCPNPEARSRGPRSDQCWPSRASAQDRGSHLHPNWKRPQYNKR